MPQGWRTAHLPEHSLFFAIGDIHSHAALLETLLNAIEHKISVVPAHIHITVVFIGDYTDRGPDAPATLDTLIDFEQRVQHRCTVVFLCGNHDEILKRLLDAPRLVETARTYSPGDYGFLLTVNGTLELSAFERWMGSGSGITTIKQYLPSLDEDWIDMTCHRFKGKNAAERITRAQVVLDAFAKAVPSRHKQFLARAYANTHYILGDYLFTHAGVDPHQTLSEQGIGTTMTHRQYLDLIMIRDPFLWRDDLPLCPYVVIHGHTPSAIENGGNIVADGQKHFRLCIDTGVYKNNGALTCFIRGEQAPYFLAVNKTVPEQVVEYT